MKERFCIDQLFEQPVGWLRASLPKIEIASRLAVRMAGDAMYPSPLSSCHLDFQRYQWLDLTGVEVSNTQFTIVVPVHNEERSLPSFLGAFFASVIPSNSEVQIVFVINASTDRSATIIKNRLSCVAPSTVVYIPDSRYDRRRSSAAFQVRHGLLRFLVVETPTAGKANALNIGNEIAVQNSHFLAMNIDANNWVEPDSIALMYKQARLAILDIRNSPAVIVNAKEYCPTRDTQVDVPVKRRIQKAEVTGCMFAWSTRWIDEINGFPQSSIEDYGTGLLALSQGRLIVESDARIWIFSPSNASDERRQMVRFYYGAMQLANRYKDDPIAMRILREDFPCLQPMLGRFQFHIRRKRKLGMPGGVIRGVLAWLFNEYLIFRASIKLREDPDGQTWDPISSTK